MNLQFYLFLAPENNGKHLLNMYFFFLLLYSWYILRDAMVEWSVHARMFAALSLTRSNDWKILTVHLSGKVKGSKSPLLNAIGCKYSITP